MTEECQRSPCEVPNNAMFADRNSTRSSAFTHGQQQSVQNNISHRPLEQALRHVTDSQQGAGRQADMQVLTVVTITDTSHRMFHLS